MRLWRTWTAGLLPHHGLSGLRCCAARVPCRPRLAAAPGTPDFALLIRQNVDYPHRLAMVRALWRVIMADGAHAPEEDATLREIETMLGIDATDSPLAGQ